MRPVAGSPAAFKVAMAIFLLALASCSTVQTTGAGASVAAQLPSEHFQLRVRTGDDRMDAAVYETAYQQFSRVMPLREAPPFTGSLEITFASAGQSNFHGPSTPATLGQATSDGWYTGGRIVNSSSSSGTFLEWQDSTMAAVLKHNNGEQLWTASYSYKGGYELSGLVINTPEKAARLVAQRLAARFAADAKK
jgi:hypothetical protein